MNKNTLSILSLLLILHCFLPCLLFSQKPLLHLNSENRWVGDLQFRELTYNFGTVKAGERVKHAFYFKNISQEPIIIQSVKSSCGCDVADLRKRNGIIPPNEENYIDYQLDTKGRSGMNSKAVMIQTSKGFLLLKVKGEILP
ncbi:MAG: DUF1573 domain-containing protein [Bacteroidia bacterium]